MLFIRGIARFFGEILNFLYNILYSIFQSPYHLLGISIILITIIFRALMLPLMLKSQRSMMKMRELKPELDKIAAKYGNSKDPEKMRAANAERQALLAKHGANPLSGCLPMLIQMPMFFGLSFIMRQSFLYIDRMRDMYYSLAVALQNVPYFIGSTLNEYGQRINLPLTNMALRHLPQRFIENNIRWMQYYNAGHSAEVARDMVGDRGDVFLLSNPDDLSRIINRFTTETWEYLYGYITDVAQRANIEGMVEALNSAESFLGLHLVNIGGLRMPYLIIPILIAITMFINSWLMQVRTYDPNADERARMMGKIMLYGMPLMMAFFTINFPTGVGIFWITGQIFQSIVDFIFLKKSKIPIHLPWQKPPVVEVVNAKK
jgi:YidC/Oxa1 family membrane protein insertase